MKIDILTLFPTMFNDVLGESIIKRAQEKGLVTIEVHNLRDWTFDSHRSADDKPFGGGPGMVMKVEPIYLALEELKALRGLPAGKAGTRDAGRKTKPACRQGRDERRGTKDEGRGTKKARVILLTPQGKTLNQAMARTLAKEKRLILVCGHYEGFDERARGLADDEISIGDYVLTCGEIPAMALIDAVVRLIPGVLGDARSLECESFEKGYLEYPQYTRLANFKGMKVPDILLSGDHKKIEAWRKKEALKRTLERRPDLLKEKKRKG